MAYNILSLVYLTTFGIVGYKAAAPYQNLKVWDQANAEGALNTTVPWKSYLNTTPYGSYKKPSAIVDRTKVKRFNNVTPANTEKVVYHSDGYKNKPYRSEYAYTTMHGNNGHANPNYLAGFQERFSTRHLNPLKLATLNVQTKHPAPALRYAYVNSLPISTTKSVLFAGQIQPLYAPSLSYAPTSAIQTRYSSPQLESSDNRVVYITTQVPGNIVFHEPNHDSLSAKQIRSGYNNHWAPKGYDFPERTLSPLLDLTLLKPLTFKSPIVPQVQHYLPKINTITYHPPPTLISNDEVVSKKFVPNYDTEDRKTSDKVHKKKPLQKHIENKRKQNYPLEVKLESSYKVEEPLSGENDKQNIKKKKHEKIGSKQSYDRNGDIIDTNDQSYEHSPKEQLEHSQIYDEDSALSKESKEIRDSSEISQKPVTSKEFSFEQIKGYENFSDLSDAVIKNNFIPLKNSKINKTKKKISPLFYPVKANSNNSLHIDSITSKHKSPVKSSTTLPYGSIKENSKYPYKEKELVYNVQPYSNENDNYSKKEDNSDEKESLSSDGSQYNEEIQDESTDSSRYGSYGPPKYHYNYDIINSPYGEKQEEQDIYPESAPEDYKKSRENVKEDYIAEYSFHKPESTKDLNDSKDNYYKLYIKHKPVKRFRDRKDHKTKNKEKAKLKIRTGPNNETSTTENYYTLLNSNLDQEENPTYPRIEYGFEPVTFPNFETTKDQPTPNYDHGISKNGRKSIYKDNKYSNNSRFSHRPIIVS